MMDVVRANRRPAVRLKRLTVPAGIAILIAAATWSTMALVQGTASEPVVDRSGVLTDVARRGTIVRSLRAQGTLVPERVQIASASADGLIEGISVRTGTVVNADSVIATLSNPDVDAAIVDIQAQIEAARAELRSVREQARALELDHRAALRSAQAQVEQSAAEAKADTSLHDQGLIPDVTYRVATIKAADAKDQSAIAARKLEVDRADAAAKAAVAQAKIEQLNAQLGARRTQRATLDVRAGASGVVQTVLVERGARVTAGTQLARIVGQHDLKATLQVPEADTRDVVLGLPVAIDTQTVVLKGHVRHIDPAAQNGTIAVDVGFDGALPPSARPDLHVEGTIELDRLRNVISIQRPASANDGASLDLYRLADGGRRAVRTHVTLGRGSPDRVAVTSGVVPGETLIVSDTSSFNNAPAVRLK